MGIIFWTFKFVLVSILRRILLVVRTIKEQKGSNVAHPDQTTTEAR